MKVFVVMRQIRLTCGAVSEPYLAFSTKAAAEAACLERSRELTYLQTWRIYQDGKDVGRNAAELLEAFGMDGVEYFVVEMELKEADLLQPADSRIVLS